MLLNISCQHQQSAYAAPLHNAYFLVKCAKCAKRSCNKFSHMATGSWVQVKSFLIPPPPSPLPSPTPVYVTLKYKNLQLILVGQNKAPNSINCLILHLWNTLFLRARKLFQYKSSILLIALQAHKRINLFSGKLKNFCRGCSSVSPRWEYKHRKFWFYLVVIKYFWINLYTDCWQHNQLGKRLRPEQVC